MPAVVTTRRRTRYDTPAWAERFPASPEGFDAMAAHGEARKLPRDTDPDSIDDPDVREAYLDQLNEELERDDSTSGAGSHSSGGGRGDRGARDGTVVHAPPSAGRWRRAIGSDAGGLSSALGVDDAAGLLLGLVGYAIGIAAFRDPTSATNGVKRWFAAKFFNQTSTTGNLTASAGDPAVTGLALLTSPLTATDATPLQPPAPANIGDILRSGLPASALAAPKPPPPAGTT